MNHQFAIYETASGKVVRVGKSSNARILEVQPIKDGEALFVGEIDPDTQYLPGGVPTPKPKEVRVVTALEVKAWAGRLLSYTDWVVVKALDTGALADPLILAKRQAIREASNTIEAMDPIPADFTDPKYWP